MRKCLLATTSIVALFSAQFSSGAVFSDTFDGRAGALTGQVADTGQTWGAFTYFGSYPSFDVAPAYGVGGTEGAGTADSNSFHGNGVAFTAVSGGAIRFETDMVTQAPPPYAASTTPLKEFFLRDTVNNTAADIYWQQSNTSIAFEGLGISDPGQATGQSPSSNAQMHVILDINLDTKTVAYSWSGVDSSNLPFSGSKNLGTYAVNFAPNDLQIWGRGESAVIGSGYDNIALNIVPEPAGLSLVALLGSAFCAGRRRRSF